MHFPMLLSRRALPIVVCGTICLLPLGCRGGAEREREPTLTRTAGDLIAAGPTLSISDSIPGDAMLAAGNIEFNGFVGGDYLGAGGSQEVRGRIGGDMRAAGGQLRIGATVARNATVAGGQVYVGQNARIGGNAYIAGGLVRMGGGVDGHLRATGGTVVIDGTVGGDVAVEADRLRIGPGARIQGDLEYRVDPDDVTIDPGAQIAGATNALPPRERPKVSFGFLRFIWLLGFLAAGAAAVALLPGTAGAAADALERRPGASVGFGVLWLIAVPIAAVIVAITVVGIPLALIAMALYAISLYLAGAVVAIWLGRQVLRNRARPGRGGLVLCFLLGGIILVLLGLIPVAGMLLNLLATLFGLGALALAFWGRPAGTP